MSRRIHRSLFGFTVEDDSGLAVTVDLEPWSFVVRSSAGVTRTGLASAEGLAREISEAFARTSRKRRSSAAVVPSLVASDVAEERRALISRVPAEVVRVHEAVEAATGSAEGIHGSRLFYERRFLVADVLALRAAAIAVGHLGELRPGSDEATTEALLDDLEDWPRLFSPTGQAYGSLRRTLARLPEGVPSGVVCGLRAVLLPRPVTDPIELVAIALSAGLGDSAGATALHMILLHSRSEEIVGAVARIGEAIDRTLSPGRPGDLLHALQYLADYPEAHAGRLAGLVAKAIAWHEAWERRPLEQALRHAGHASLAARLDTPTARPPFPLPDLPGFRFLETVGEIAREGREMNHCVATRAGAAVAGDAFLFHVEYAGEQATIEAARYGRIVGAGPSNRRNAASIWGVARLRESTGWRQPLYLRCGYLDLEYEDLGAPWLPPAPRAVP